MTRPWLAPLATVLLGAAVAGLAATHVQPPPPSVPVCEYAAESGPHAAGDVMTCWTSNEGDRP